jgi:hypothetical protein
MSCHHKIVLLFGLGGLLTACADSAAGSGRLKISISGEEASLAGYPVGSGDDEIAFSDGWTLEFEKILISLDAFELESADGDSAGVESGPVIADLHKGMPELWSFDDVPAQRWDRVGYRYVVPSDRSRKANDIDQDALERMIDEGYSFYVEGVAKKGDREIPIEWGFAFELELTRCENGRDGTDGIVVAENKLNEAEVTVHLDHLFFDSFAVDDAELCFDAMAAVAPEDGPLTLDDLAKQNNLSAPKDADGELLDLVYDPGSTFNPVPKTLKDFVIGAASTTGHWNGEGHCHYEID